MLEAHIQLYLEVPPMSVTPEVQAMLDDPFLFLLKAKQEGACNIQFPTVEGAIYFHTQCRALKGPKGRAAGMGIELRRNKDVVRATADPELVTQAKLVE